MNPELFCGLTEQEANEALDKWYFSAAYPKCPPEGIKWIDFYRPGAWTSSTSSCRLIETRLSDEQWLDYEMAINEAIGWPQIQSHRHLISLDAPTRVRALLTVLGLGKGDNDAN